MRTYLLISHDFHVTGSSLCPTVCNDMYIHTVFWESSAEIKFHEFREVNSIHETLFREC